MKILINLIRKDLFSVPLFEEEIKSLQLTEPCFFCKDEEGEVENNFVRYCQSPLNWL